MPRHEVCTVKHRTIETEDRCPRRHPNGIRERQRRRQEAAQAPQPLPERLTPEEQYARNLIKFAREQAAMLGIDLDTVERPNFDWFAKTIRLTERDAQTVWDRQHRPPRNPPSGPTGRA